MSNKKQPPYLGIATLVVTFDYANGATQITPINLDASVFWMLAKQVMETAHTQALANQPQLAPKELADREVKPANE